MSTYLQSSEKEREYIRKKLNCTEETLKRDVQHLIEWLEKQPHLPSLKEENMLLLGLLNCKNSLQKVKSALEKYFTARALFPEFYRDRDILGEKIKNAAELGTMVPSRKLTPDGYRVIMFSLSENVKNMNQSMGENIIKLLIMGVEVVANYDYSRGYIVFIDGKHITLPLILAFSSIIQKTILFAKVASGIHYEKIYLCHVGRTIDTLIAMLKIIGAKKFIQKIEVLENDNDLCTIFPREIIPRNYGGDELPLEELKDMWYEVLKNESEFLKMFENIDIDLSKISKDYINSDLFGMNGSFRQLSVD